MSIRLERRVDPNRGEPAPGVRVDASHRGGPVNRPRVRSRIE